MISPDKIGINDIANVWKKHRTLYESPLIFFGTDIPTAGKLTL
jgi:hypothetical protein